MATRYVFVRMPTEVYNLFYNKKIRMERDIKEVTGKKIPITMPKVFRMVGANPVEIDIDSIINIASKKRGRR